MIDRALPLAALALTVVATIAAQAQQTPLVRPAEQSPTNDTGWPSYNGTLNGQRYSPLDQINVENAATLGEICRVKIDDSGSFHTGLVLVGKTLYFTTARVTLAVDATNCEIRWRNSYVPEQSEVFPNNRGVAYENGRLFRGTADGRLLAIDAATGKTIWQEQAGDPEQAEFFSAAPVAWQGLFIIGTAGGDWGIRGRIMAFDQQTGREVWRFYTIPRGDEVGADSWKDRKTARYGGGGSWTSYSIDMASGEVFVPVGNPAPDFMRNHRPGENLFTDSMVVLDARTGALKWWYQLVGHDGHDLDLGAAPMLYWNGKGEPMVAIGGKDGLLYGVDRESHKQVFATEITTVKKSAPQPTAEGVHVCPGVLGGIEWNGAAYDKKMKQIVVGSVDWCMTLKSKPAEFHPGEVFLAGEWVNDDEHTGWVHALDPDTGKVRWKHHADAPVVAGVTPTAGGVTFTGDMTGNFLVFDSASGKLLLKAPTGGSMAGGVITYSIAGKQYVAATSGNVSRLTFGEGGSPTLVVFGLGGKAAPAASAAVEPLAALSAGNPDPKRGKEVYGKNCVVCHGGSGEGAAGPSLRGIGQKLDFEAAVRWIEQPSSKMPKLYPKPLDAQAVADVAAYIRGF
jgi:alcohol dehydrogenase (cytochrome c)